MVRRVAFFVSGGYTEVGGMTQFLRHISSDISCIRLFPAVRKPAPKKGLDTPAPVGEHSGVTGDHLVSEMILSLKNALRKGDEYDAVLLVDDGDCRFSDASGLRKWIANVEKRLHEEAGFTRPLFTLIASPEVEAWLCADWDSSFGVEYPQDIQRRVRNEASRRRIVADDGEPELFGMPPKKDGGCSEKLSELLQKIFLDICKSSRPFSYSKRVEGQAMLKRIRPEKVAEKCRLFFRPVFMELHEWLTVTKTSCDTTSKAR